MAEEIEKLDLNNIPYENSPVIKKESYIDVCETSISLNDTELKENIWGDTIKVYKIASIEDAVKIELPSAEESNIVINDNVKIKEEIGVDDIKIEFNNELLFCDHCDEHYKDYCTKCDMLAHILNGTPLSIGDKRAIQEIPNAVLEIRESSGHVGVFALKVIPESVKIGPFNGLYTSECSLRLQGGKFLVDEDKTKSLNWMQHINPARNMFQQNLIPFQCEDKLYYKCIREILAGEELLVYFGAEYADSLHKNIEMDFVPPIEDDVRDVFGCTFCCLGFSSKAYLIKHKSSCSNETNYKFFIDEYADSLHKNIEMDFVPPMEDDVRDVFACSFCCLGFSSKAYLAKHKGICPNKSNEKFSIDEIKQCPFCKIYFYEKEYLECHKPYCGERNVRKCIPLALDKQIEVSRRKLIQIQMYKCKQCKYKTAFKADLKNHFNKHYKVKMYRCEVCYRQFKTNRSLKLHAKSIHADIERKEDQKCSTRHYTKTNTKAGSSKVHLKEFGYDCNICDYKTNRKLSLKTHIKTKHLKEFSNECELCSFKTNYKYVLEKHIKTKHLKEFSYECEICGYRTNYKQDFEKHLKSVHLKEYNFDCDICGYKTNRKISLEIHIKTIHLKEFSLECELCSYKTNKKARLKTHIKSKHLKEFSYECEICDYKTNIKSDLESHIKTIHLKDFKYECEICNYKTNIKVALERHIKTKHLKEFSYECEKCDYKTNVKPHLIKHIKRKHEAH